ncbi:unnamed protein product [Bursaphelenchus xylophilus]|uniref:(pine wood nematode) hypothetical protein n=1 Tax=Bursaphelenchus xylophilus TaxID=6326 RepID=A0A1I7SGG3_BURXY|nr:unnamed protein product [Bursaphelenchus xylophilus]CAG9101669.1 unnamed protein product [Bursaphelenchus xylophilus]
MIFKLLLFFALLLFPFCWSQPKDQVIPVSGPKIQELAAAGVRLYSRQRKANYHFDGVESATIQFDRGHHYVIFILVQDDYGQLDKIRDEVWSSPRNGNMHRVVRVE